MAKIIDNSDFRKERVLEVLEHLPEYQQKEIEDVIYEQKDNFSKITLYNLRLLTSDSYLKALSIKDQLKSKYNSTFASKSKSLSLTELLQSCNVTISQLLNIINVQLIKLNEKTIVPYQMDEDVAKYMTGTKAGDFISALNSNQRTIIKKFCILDQDILSVELPTQEDFPYVYGYKDRINYLTRIGNQVVDEMRMNQNKK